MEKVFDTKVQELKYEVLKEIIKCAYDGDMSGVYTDIQENSARSQGQHALLHLQGARYLAGKN